MAPGKNGNFRDFFKEKEYMKMILANIISRFGDSLDSIAYSWMVYELTGSKSWLAVVFGVNALPTVLLQPLGGALVEFLDKKKTVVLCDIGRGIVVGLTGALLIAGLLTPWGILALTFINSSLEALRMPCGTAIVPCILSRENYTAGISCNQSLSRIAELAGLGAAGAVIGLMGSGGALLVDGMTFFLSAFLLSFLKLADTKRHKGRLSASGYREDLREGFSYFKKAPVAVILCAACVMLNAAELPLTNLQAAYVSEGLRLSVLAMSVGSTSMTAGMILGALLCPALSRRLSVKMRMMGGGIVIGILYFILSGLGDLPSAAWRYLAFGGCLFFFGSVSAVIDVTLRVVMYSEIPPEYMGRVGGIFTALAMASVPVISAVVAAAAAFLTIEQIYIAVGILSVAAFALPLKSKGALHLEAISAERE